MRALPIIASFALLGCSPPAIDDVHRGELTDSDPRVPHDGSRYDQYAFEAEAGWTIDLELKSEAFDTYLWLVVPGSPWRLQDDDGFGDGTNSAMTTTAPTRGTYQVIVNSYDPGERGAYVLRIRARP